jgi:hypothetical protein
MENPNFLKQKYNLHNAPEVEAAAKRTEKRTGEKVPQDPEDQIQNYLDRFTEIIERKEPAKRERGIEALKHILHDKFIIKPKEIPESYFESQKRLAREQGHGDIEISDELRNQLTEVIITDQKGSLDQWINYLSSDDATYPDWLKYYTFRSILSMGEYDKEKKQFTKRSKGTVKTFPDINREALAYVLDAIEKKYKGKIPAETDLEFKKYLAGENFAKLYAFAIDKVTPATESALASTKGEWVKYRQGRDHMPLVNSLQGHGTGWCTAGESTAEAQLKNGDFYVYYTLDENGKPNIPRAAIRMQEESIAEVRGIAPDQNLDPYIGDIVQKKLKEFPDGTAYEKKNNDMKILTLIENKTKQNILLNKDELIFLYEINSPIEGFGYQKDPRIKEIRDQRNPKFDAPIVFECAPEEIAYNKDDINEKTKAYVGELFKGIFQINIENIYTTFPEGRIEKGLLEIGGLTEEELERQIKSKKDSQGRNYQIYSYAESMMRNRDFTVSKKPEQIELVHLKVRDLGFAQNPTTNELYAKAKELGLELCPAETGPHLRLKYEDVFKREQPISEYLRVAMKQIADSDGYPGVFGVDRDDDGFWLYNDWAEPANGWDLGSEFVFRLRKFET